MKKILCLILVVLTILSNSLCVFAANTTVSSTTNITTENPGLKGQNSVKTSEAAFFADKLPKCEDLSPDKLPKYLKDNAKAIGLPQNGDFSYKKMSEDELGIKHLRYAQLYNGIPVFGKEIIVDVKGGEISSVQGMISPDASQQKVAVSNTIDKNKARGIAEAYIDYKPAESKQSSQTNDSISTVASKCGDPELVWLDDNNTRALTYRINVSSIRPKLINKTLFIDAVTGKIVKELDNIRTEAYTGTGKGVLNDTKSVNLYLANNLYYLRDVTLGDATGATKTILEYNYRSLDSDGNVYLMYDNNGKLCESNSEFLSQRAAVDAHYYFNLAYKYYRDVFRRTSYDNLGSNIISFVHYTPDGFPWANAAWTGNDTGLFLIGDGDSFAGGQKEVYEFSASLDVMGHEFTHAVIENSNGYGLVYQNQSGAIDESLADLFGQIIERKYKKDSDWTIGEDMSIGTNDSYKRSLSNPELYGQPADMSQYVTTAQDNGGVHINSGIPNKAAYLIASQLGDDKTAQIYYYAIMNKLTASADFVSLRRAVISSANALYPGTSYAGVIAGAFDQVGITDPIIITSINTTPASPQKLGAKIRWTCTTSGGTCPVYYYKIYKGSTVITQSSAYSTNNYFDWTPTEEGTNYRALVYVKEAGSANSTSVTMLSDYYIIDNNTISRYMGRDITGWVIDDQRGYIYGISSDKSLMFIRLSDLYIENTITFEYAPSDIEISDDKLFISISEDTKINVVDIATKAIDKTITTQNNPYRIAVDGNKLFYTKAYDSSGLYVYDMGSGQEQDITSFVYLHDYELDLAVDRTNHILYTGESDTYGSKINAIRTDDYSTVSQSTYNGKVGFLYPDRKIVYDDGDIFYAWYNLNAENLAVINGCYNETIIYAKGNYVFTGKSVYDRDNYVKIKDLPLSSTNILVDAAGYTYLFDNQSSTLYKQRISYTLDTSMKHTNTFNKVLLDEQLTSWVSSEDGSYIYAVSESSNKLLFIRTSDLTVEKEMYVGSKPSDIELANGYLYIPLSGSTKLIVIDPATGVVSKNISVKECPYRIAIDGNKLFYVGYDQRCSLYIYDLSTGEENSKPGDDKFYEPDLAIDRINQVLYCGESEASYSRIFSFSTADYSVLSVSRDLYYSFRRTIYDAGSIYYAGRRLEANNLGSVLCFYSEPIVYARDTYVFSKNHIFNKISNQPVVTFDKTADLALMLNDNSYLLYNDEARSLSKKGPLPIPIKIVSLAADKTSPQLTNTTIRWTCNITGGDKPVYYFRVYKGSTLVSASTAYSAANYFDWTPTVAGTNYRVQVNVKEDGLADSTSESLYSGYYTVTAPIVVTSLVPDKASPQPTGTKIRWTCNITGGVKPVYYFKILKGSTVVSSSTTYTTANYFDWTPNAAGTDYRALVYVREPSSTSSSIVTRYSSYYTVTVPPTPIVIKSVTPDKASPQLTNTTVRWTCNIAGGGRPVYYFRVYKGSTLVKNSAAYSATNYFDWTPTEPGKDYRVLVNVKEDGTANSTSVAMYSGYYTVTAPIVITSLVPDKTSPQPTGTKIRWTCSITGGNKPVYYFKIFKGSTLVSSSTAYTAANYLDWTPTAAGADYRALVYVREPGSASSTIVTRYSSYFTVTAPPTPIVIKSVVPDKTSPQQTNTSIRWTCNITGGTKPVYYFRVYKGTTLVTKSLAYSAANYFDWTPTEAGTDYRILVNVKEDGTANSTSTAMYSSYYTVTAPAPKVIETPEPEMTDPGLGSINIIDIPLVK